MSGLAGSHRVTITRLRSEAGLDRENDADAAARLVVQSFIEPGDAVAGAAVAVLGAELFVEAVLQGADARKLSAMLLDRGATEGDKLVSAIGAGLRRWRPRIDDELGRSIDQAGRIGAVPIVPGDALWPGGLDALGLHRPVALWMRGRPEVLRSLSRSIALVGARAATPYGEHVAVEAAAGLVERGVAVVSGAAYGIDGAAHRAALARDGGTIAVLAGGIDRYYPAGHEALLNRIAERGVIVAEVPCGTAPTKWRFLQRNRMIAAMSGATVVVEAGVRSGSLNTAGHAASLARPLGVVPGPVTSPASAGCHRLLREYDAVCVTSAGEMAELLGDDSITPRQSRDDAPSSDEVRVIDALGVRAARSVTDIARRSGLEPARVRAVLGHLELGGEAALSGDGWVRRPRST